MAESKTVLQPGERENLKSSLAETEEILAFRKQAFEIASRASRACFKCAAEYNQEWTDFVTSRLKKDVEAVQATIRSKTGEEAMKAQTDFVNELLKDYAEETTRIFALGAEAFKEAFAPEKNA